MLYHLQTPCQHGIVGRYVFKTQAISVLQYTLHAGTSCVSATPTEEDWNDGLTKWSWEVRTMTACNNLCCRSIQYQVFPDVTPVFFGVLLFFIFIYMLLSSECVIQTKLMHLQHWSPLFVIWHIIVFQATNTHLHLSPSDIMVLAKGQWCSEPRKITTGLVKANGSMPSRTKVTNFTCGLTSYRQTGIQSGLIIIYKYETTFSSV